MIPGPREQRMNMSGGLRLEDFRQIRCQGFANSSMRISQAIAWYKVYLFAGTGRVPLRPLGLSLEALAERPVLSRLTARLLGPKEQV
jgi:hypothetical protein